MSSVPFIEVFLFQVVSLISIAVASLSLYKLVAYLRNNDKNLEAEFTVDQSTANWLYSLHAFFILIFLYCAAINVMLLIGVNRVS